MLDGVFPLKYTINRKTTILQVYKVFTTTLSLTILKKSGGIKILAQISYRKVKLHICDCACIRGRIYDTIWHPGPFRGQVGFASSQQQLLIKLFLRNMQNITEPIIIFHVILPVVILGRLGLEFQKMGNYPCLNTFYPKNVLRHLYIFFLM